MMKRRAALLLTVLLLPFSSHAGERVIKVLTYNIHGIPLPGISHDRYKDIGFLLKQRQLNGSAPDLVVIQEAFVSRTNELNQAAGYPYSKRGPTENSHSVLSSGLLILSQFPIISGKNQAYSRCAGWDCLAAKGIQMARVEIPGLPTALSLFNTHLNSDKDGNPDVSDKECAMARWGQLQEASDFIFERKREHDDAVIFPGDFNCKTESDEFKSFLYWSNLDYARLWAKESYAAIDHHFFGQGFAPRVRITPIAFAKTFTEPYKGRMLSDHDGLEVDYLLRW